MAVELFDRKIHN